MATGTQSNGDLGNSGKALTSIRERIESRLHYPISLQRRGIQGTVLLQLELSEAGVLKSSAISQSSGHTELDQLALDATAKAAAQGPFQLTAEVKQPLSVRLPIEFKLSH
jgi:TonB family protein